LHDVDEKELIAGAGKGLPLSGKAPAANKVLGGEDLSALFGLDMAQGAASPGATAAKPKRAKAPKAKIAPPATRKRKKLV
jgi:hypothetical protein